MAEWQGAHIIYALQRQWRLHALLSRILLALALMVLITVVVYKADGSLWWSIPIGISCLLWSLLPRRTWRISVVEVVRHLNISFPEMEESCGLLLKPYDTLSLLERLQVQKVEPVLHCIVLPQPFKHKLRIAIAVFITAVLISTGLLLWPTTPVNDPQGTKQTTSISPSEQVLPEISAVTITITPPAYTRKALREQQQFNLEVEEGAQLRWQIRTNQPVPALQLIFNDTTLLTLQANNKDSTLWSGSSTATHPGFYQVKLAGKLSELYKIAVIKDQPPVITIQSPKAYTVIDYGEPQKVVVKVTLSDDYGITGAAIQATVASGSGEAVQFKEQPISFGAVFNGTRTQYVLEKTINLAALGMQPGSELYFYVQAQDNHQQSSRSGMHMVVLPDTAQLMSLEGLANSVNVKPEYFRSQRQIIIETEQLIRDKDTISEKAFKNRSNELGIDQRLLRLRYGKFLGEETETNIGDERIDPDDHDHDHEETEAVNPKDFNNAEKIADQFSHRHDIAEDASFFDPATKSQLKATLTEMWNAELRLRTFKPQEALPYEYKALRLLKDLQQKSRAYVAKTSIKTPPLKPEKRLAGDLSKIILPVRQYSYEPATAATDQLAYALAILEELKGGVTVLDPASLRVLQQAARQMSSQATAAPARYLSALQAMRQILEALEQKGKIHPAAITQAAQAIYGMLPAPVQLPRTGSTVSGVNLSQQYFMNLNQQPSQ